MDGAELVRLSVIVVLVLVACEQAPSARQVPGDYVIHYDYGRETLVLKDGGAYEQVFVANDGKVIRNEGKWEMRGRELLLLNAMDVDNGFGSIGDPSKRGDWHLVPARSGGTIVITVNPDRKERYEKQR